MSYLIRKPVTWGGEDLLNTVPGTGEGVPISLGMPFLQVIPVTECGLVMLGAPVLPGMPGRNEVTPGPYALDEVKGKGILVHLYALHRPHHHPQDLIIYYVLLVAGAEGEVQEAGGIVDEVGSAKGTEQT